MELNENDRNSHTIPSVSVIVPVYNPGPGIANCIKSLRTQTLENIEIIFVDDCGDDGAMDMVRETALQDSRIRILQNERNLGSGHSRNRGIEAARGDYLSFVDADDYVSPDFYELLWNKAQAEGFPDILKGTRLSVIDGAVQKPSEASHANARINGMLAEGFPLWAVFRNQHQSAIYRRSLIVEHAVLYGTSRLGQDNTFLLRFCSHAASFALEERARYYLVGNNSSITRRYSVDMLDNRIHALSELMDYLSLHNCDPKHAGSYLDEVIRYYVRFGIRMQNETNDREAVQRFFERTTEQLRRFPDVDGIKGFSVPLLAALDYGIYLTDFPYEPSGGKRYAQDCPIIVHEWLRFCDSYAQLDNSVLNDAIHAMRATLASFSQADAIEGSSREVKESKDAIRYYLNHSSSRISLFLKDPRLAIFSISGNTNLFGLRMRLQSIAKHD
ncbi:MAG: glycosyltransferase family 2 protein [Atopobiaceae bacterium]|nr:glycosyltransferase family 2 protein [Atopobiaceae bacterium]